MSYDPNGYCSAAIKSSTVTISTRPASATVGAASAVDLLYTRPGGTVGRVAMTKISESTAGATWSGAISTATDRLISTAGTLTLQARATTAGGQVASSAGGWFSVVVCPNVAPSFGTVSVPGTGLYTNPLGSGTVPAGATTVLTAIAGVSDTDGVSGVTLTLSGAGLAAPVTVPMTNGTGWGATVDLSAARVTGGTLAWVMTATDGKGLAATRSGTVTVSRANTPGTASVTGVATSPGSMTLTAVADDADVTWGVTRPSLTMNLTWSAAYTDAGGARTASGTVAAAWATGHTFAATVPVAWLTTAVRNLTVTVTPVATDGYGSTTTGTPGSFVRSVSGAPTVVAAAAGVASVYVNPLGTGVVPAGGATAIPFSADVRDTDAVAGVVVSYTGPGVTTARTVALTYDTAGGRWTGSLAMAASGITGPGTLSWRIVATDAAGNTTAGAAATVTVVKADTRGTIAVTGYRLDTSGNVVVTIAASDPDGISVVQLKWYGTAGTVSWPVTYANTTSANGVYTAVIPIGTYLRAAGSATLTWQPIVRDAIGCYSPSAITTVTVRPGG